MQRLHCVERGVKPYSTAGAATLLLHATGCRAALFGGQLGGPPGGTPALRSCSTHLSASAALRRQEPTMTPSVTLSKLMVGSMAEAAGQAEEGEGAGWARCERVCAGGAGGAGSGSRKAQQLATNDPLKLSPHPRLRRTPWHAGSGLYKLLGGGRPGGQHLWCWPELQTCDFIALLFFY